MKKIFIWLFMMFLCASAWAEVSHDTVTQYYVLRVPEEGSMDWTKTISDDFVSIDSTLHALSIDTNSNNTLTHNLSVDVGINRAWLQYGGVSHDIEMGNYSLDGGTGITLDPDNDGTHEVVVSGVGTISTDGYLTHRQLSNSTLHPIRLANNSVGNTCLQENLQTYTATSENSYYLQLGGGVNLYYVVKNYGDSGINYFHHVNTVLKVGDGTPTNTQAHEDAYIEGKLEVDKLIHADGNIVTQKITADRVSCDKVICHSVTADVITCDVISMDKIVFQSKQPAMSPDLPNTGRGIMYMSQDGTLKFGSVAGGWHEVLGGLQTK